MRDDLIREEKEKEEGNNDDDGGGPAFYTGHAARGSAM